MILSPGPGLTVHGFASGAGTIRFSLGPVATGLLIERITYLVSASANGTGSLLAGVAGGSEASDAALAAAVPVVQGNPAEALNLRGVTVSWLANEVRFVSLPIGSWVVTGSRWIVGSFGLPGAGIVNLSVSVYTRCLLASDGGRVRQLPAPGSG